MSVANVKRTAAATVTIGSDVVGRLTSFGASTTVSEEMVSGTQQTTSTDNAILEEYVPVSVGKVANVGGVSLYGDDGQSAIETAADDATEEITVEVRYEDGSGFDYEGFFTNYETSAELPNVERFTAQFRVNDKTVVSAPS